MKRKQRAATLGREGSGEDENQPVHRKFSDTGRVFFSFIQIQVGAL